MGKSQIVLDNRKHKSSIDLINKIREHFNITNVHIKENKMVIDLTKVEVTTSDDFENTVLQEGKYNEFIDTAEFCTTKDGTGEYIKVMWKLTDAPNKNRTIFHNFNVKNKNEKATQIGLEGLKKLFLVNKRQSMILNSAKDLLGLRGKLTVKVKTSTEYGDQNNVTNITEYDGPGVTGISASTTAPGYAKSSGSPIPGL